MNDDECCHRRATTRVCDFFRNSTTIVESRSNRKIGCRFKSMRHNWLGGGESTRRFLPEIRTVLKFSNDFAYTRPWPTILRPSNQPSRLDRRPLPNASRKSCSIETVGFLSHAPARRPTHPSASHPPTTLVRQPTTRLWRRIKRIINAKVFATRLSREIRSSFARAKTHVHTRYNRVFPPRCAQRNRVAMVFRREAGEFAKLFWLRIAEKTAEPTARASAASGRPANDVKNR